MRTENKICFVLHSLNVVGHAQFAVIGEGSLFCANGSSVLKFTCTHINLVSW